MKKKKAGRAWYLHLRNNLIKYGFKQSDDHDGSSELTQMTLYY
jgi:hypothetical protein